MTTIETAKLAIASILVPPRLRPIDPATVEMLAASFAERGQDTRIIVRVSDDEDEGLVYRLIAGAHRLAAATRLGWTHIAAEIVEAGDDEARLIEIDENLVRRELSALDRAIFLAERKAVWERLHPETAHGGARKSRKEQVANLATWSRFSKDAANRTGLSERTIQRAAELVRRLHPAARDALRLSDLADNQSQLFALADLEPEAQLAVARTIAEGQATSLAKAKEVAGLAPRRSIDPAEAAFERFLGLWARAGRPLRKRIRDYVTSKASADVPVVGEDKAAS